MTFRILHRWCTEVATACGGSPDSVELSYTQKEMCQAICDVTKEPAMSFWAAFRDAVVKCQMKPRLSIFPAATDCRYIRELGIPALGFSALPHTPFLLHDHDEYVGEDIFIKGIKVYEEILRGITSV